MYEWTQSTPRTMIKLDPCYVVMEDISAVSECVYDKQDQVFVIPYGYRSVLTLTNGRMILCKLTPDEVFAILKGVNKKKP